MKLGIPFAQNITGFTAIKRYEQRGKGDLPLAQPLSTIQTLEGLATGLWGRPKQKEASESGRSCKCCQLGDFIYLTLKFKCFGLLIQEQ